MGDGPLMKVIRDLSYSALLSSSPLKLLSCYCLFHGFQYTVTFDTLLNLFLVLFRVVGGILWHVKGRIKHYQSVARNFSDLEFFLIVSFMSL